MPSLADLLNMGKNYVKDSLPGGLLNPEVNTQGILDGAALSTTAVPVLGDLLGLGADLNRYKNEPESRTIGNFALSGLGMLPFVPSMAGMFIGKNAKTWDAVSMGKAQEMAKSGADPRAIWKETGTWQGPDGAWRQEIPDNNAVIGTKAKIDLVDNEKFSGVLPQALWHNTLYEAYPELRKINVEATLGPSKGAYAQSGDIMMQGPGFPSLAGTGLHEAQHAIQNSEGWARGGNIGEFKDHPRNAIYRMQQAELVESANAMMKEEMARKTGKSTNSQFTGLSDSALYEKINKYNEAIKSASANAETTSGIGQYKRQAGEAEARATQARINLSADQRRALFPEDSYDLPLSSLIFRR